MENKVFTKDKISLQSTIVLFRNGLYGLAVNDRMTPDDHDGDERFIIYDREKRCFVDSVRLTSYDDQLKNTLSVKGILNKINNVKNGYEAFGKVDDLGDSDWDVIAASVYAYAHDAFIALTSFHKIHMNYKNLNSD